MLTHNDQALRDTAQDSFWNRFEKWGRYFDGLIEYRPSNSDQETTPIFGYPAKMQEMAGETKVSPIPSWSQTTKNKKFQSGFAITYEMRKFARNGVVASLAGALGEKARGHETSLASDAANNGHSTACYDTQYFFDTDHTDPGGRYATAQDNDLTANITSPTAPTDLEMATAIRAIRAALLGYLDNEGDPVANPEMLSPANFVVMVPANLSSIAKRVLLADSLTGPLGNDLKGQFTLRENPHLTAATASTGVIYGFNAGGARKPFALQVADPLRTWDTLEESQFDAYYHAFMYGAITYADWRYACRYEFT